MNESTPRNFRDFIEELIARDPEFAKAGERHKLKIQEISEPIKKRIADIFDGIDFSRNASFRTGPVDYVVIEGNARAEVNGMLIAKRDFLRLSDEVEWISFTLYGLDTDRKQQVSLGLVEVADNLLLQAARGGRTVDPIYEFKDISRILNLQV